MGKIIIRADDSFESVAAAKPANLKEHQERVKVLKRDVSLATKIEKKQDAVLKHHAAINNAKKAPKTPARTNKLVNLRAQVVDLREEIKALKGELSTPLNAKLSRAKEQLTKAQMAKADHSSKHLPRNQKTQRSGDSAKVKRSEQKVTKPAVEKPIITRKVQKRIDANDAKIAELTDAIKNPDHMMDADRRKAFRERIADLKGQNKRLKTEGEAFIGDAIRKLPGDRPVKKVRKVKSVNRSSKA